MMKNKSDLHRHVMLCKLLSCLILALILPSQATMPAYAFYGFGSKVAFADGDEGYPLNHCCLNLGFWDIGREKGVYDDRDPVYLIMNGNNFISINSIRITPFAGYAPGSKVKRTDADINAQIISFRNWSIAYLDSNDDSIYGLEDSLYLHNRSCGNQIVPGDIRLTFFQGFLPGTRVRNSNADSDLAVSDLMSIDTSDVIPQVVVISFYNANGNYLKGSPQYDLTDPVYLHVIAPETRIWEGIIGLVGANDLRLSF